MTEQELIERIDSLSGQLIDNMCDESLKMLTLNFKESLVRRIIALGPTLCDQEEILKRINNTLMEYYRANYNDLPYWVNDAIDAIKNIRFDLDCGILIKNQPESVDFNKAMDDYKNNKLTSEEINELLLNADTINYTSDNTNPTTALEQRIEELEEENEQLKSKVTLLEKQLEKAKAKPAEEDTADWAKEKEHILIALLTPIFNKDRETAMNFSEEVSGQDNIEIIEILSRYVKQGKVSKTLVRRKLWSILHSFRIYTAEESNWNLTLNNRI